MNLTVERSELLERYRRLRAIMRDLHSELGHSVSKDTFTRCGEKLGFFVDGTLVFETEDESPDMFSNGRTATAGRSNNLSTSVATGSAAAGLNSEDTR